jgi:histidinol dehydrogenase
MRMLDWNSLDKVGRSDALARPILQSRAEAARAAAGIIERVRREGDAALFALTEKFDGVRLDRLTVNRDEFAAANRALTSDQIAALRRAAVNVKRFHEGQLRLPLNVETGALRADPTPHRSCRTLRTGG